LRADDFREDFREDLRRRGLISVTVSSISIVRIGRDDFRPLFFDVLRADAGLDDLFFLPKIRS
jgi:hypothetical protein